MSKLASYIKEMAEDLSSLELATYEQDAEATLPNHLLSYSRFDLDGDSIHYMAKGEGETDKGMMDLHLALIQEAMRSRKAMLSILKTATKGISLID